MAVPQTVCYDFNSRDPNDPNSPLVLGAYKTMLAIYTALAALTAGQRANVWADFTSGNPPKWALDEGPNAPDLMIASQNAIDNPAGLAAGNAKLVKFQMEMVAVYLYDNPTYLTVPAFDPTINVKPYTPFA